jgi:hypothetical protein
MNLIDYKNFYVKDEGHWYISKIKQYDEGNINVMAQGLLLLSNLLSPISEPKTVEKFKKFRRKDEANQLELFENRSNLVPIDDDSQLFLSLEILANGLVDLKHMEQTNQEKFITFSNLRSEFISGKNGDFFIDKYGIDYLRREFTVYFRNFFSWLSKYGFIGIQSYSKYCFITDAGKEFTRNCKNPETTAALFHNQIQKVQVWNPTLPTKYSDFKVIPYYVILQVLALLPDQKITRNEYILFLTKIKSHHQEDIQNSVDLIQSFRHLSSDEQTKYIDEIKNLDNKKFPERTRTNFERLSDSSGKEIFAYTFGGLISVQNGVIHLLNLNQAQYELGIFNKSPRYIEFQTKQDWVLHLGSLDGLEIDDIIDVYLRNGKSAEEIKEILKNVEKDIDIRIENRLFESEVENFYIKNIEKIQPDLNIIHEPKPGQQFLTDIGVIDTLCKDNKTGEFVVLEFKRAQVSDDTIGQVLRYMGWVSMNMENTGKKVRGIIIGRDFSEKLHYSIFGVQDESFLDLLTVYSHPFDENNRPNIAKE